MNVLVLLKQVPDTESLIEINAAADYIKTDNIKWLKSPPTMNWRSKRRSASGRKGEVAKYLCSGGGNDVKNPKI